LLVALLLCVPRRAGRIYSRRQVSAKLLFMDLRDSLAKVQILADQRCACLSVSTLLFVLFRRIPLPIL
jgi:lysyl-tRNA synthetase class II